MIGFIGLSHLGIVYSLATAAKGFDVLGFHPDAVLCGDLTSGKFPFTEPGLEELFQSHRSRIRFSGNAAELARCDLVFVSLDVCTDQNNESDLGPLYGLIDSVAGTIEPTATVVLLCQVPPGFTRSLKSALLGRGIKWAEGLCYQVETLIFGRAVERALRPERFIVGSEDPRRALRGRYAEWLNAFGCPLLLMRYESAELTKIAINLFLVSHLATTNTLAEVCEWIGADWSEMVPALRLDGRIGPHAYLSPGLGFAGGNLERDLITVKRVGREVGVETGIVDAWIRNSEHRKEWTTRTLREAFRSRGVVREEATVAIWGLAYKENTDSVRNSPSLAFISSIPDCRKRAYDPAVKLLPGSYPLFERLGAALDCCQGADALVVATPWPQFRNADLKAIHALMRTPIVLDPYGLLEGERASTIGLDYYRLGAPPRPASARLG